MGGFIRFVTVKVNPIRTCSQNIWHLFALITPSLTVGLLPGLPHPHPCLRHIFRRRRVLLYVFVVPAQVSFITIADVTWPRDAVILVGINNQLRIDPEAAQCLVHLLAALDRHVEVALAAEKQRRRLDPVGVQERIGDFLISLPRFRIPRRTNFIVVLNDVLIGAVESDGEGRARAAGGALETSVGGDHVISEYPAIAPTA